MLFTEILHAIRPYLLHDTDVPEFMRNIIQIICDVPEKDWDTKNDPSSEKNYLDNTLRKFYSRGITKKLAKKILKQPTKNTFVSAINDDNRKDIERGGLVKALIPFDKNVTSENVAEKLFDLLFEGLQGIVHPEIEAERSITVAKQQSSQLKKAYGSGLLDDCQNTCSMPGCSHHLQTLSDIGQSVPDYEIIRIDESKEFDISNICAVCHDCFQKYVLKHTKKEKSALKKIKKFQEDTRKANGIISQIAIDKGIELVIKNLEDLTPSGLKELNYHPVPVDHKIDEEKDMILANTVQMFATKFYFPIQEIMKRLVREENYPDEYIRSALRELYLRLERQGMSPMEIFEELAGQIHKITKQPPMYCNIVIAYFVQSCEVFHDITK